MRNPFYNEKLRKKVFKQSSVKIVHHIDFKFLE